MAYPKAGITGVCTEVTPIVIDGDERGHSLSVRTEGGGRLFITAWATDFLASEVLELVRHRVFLTVELGGRTYTNKDGDVRGAVQATLVDIREVQATFDRGIAG